MFRSLTKALEELESIIRKIRDLHYPPGSKTGEIWEWISKVYNRIETGDAEEYLERIKENIREAQRVFEKIENEYQDVRLSIRLAIIASYLRFLFPVNKFLASLVKEGKNTAKEVHNYGKMWYGHLKILEDQITEEENDFTMRYL